MKCVGVGVLTCVCVCVLQVFHQLQSALCGSSVSVHLVEVSPKLSEVQARSLITTHTEMSVSDEESVYRTGTTHPGIPVSWYRRLEDVPRGTHQLMH